MADIAITVDGGTTKKLLTAGKYCDRNIVVTATGGGGEPEPPQDGKTRLYIHVPPNSEPNRPPARNQVPLYIQQTVSRGVTIDWGDGSEPEALEGTGKVNTTHTYQEGGDFVITLEVAEGCELGLGHRNSSYCIMGSISYGGRAYCNMLQRVVIGDGVANILAYTFHYCYSLSSITIPDSITSIGSYAFSQCSSLFSIVIPKSITTIPSYAFEYCNSLSFIKIPNLVTEIGSYAFQYCRSLSSVTISDSVTKIGSYAFQYCIGIKEIHLKPISPPTLSKSNAFTDIPSDCIIFVPKGSLGDYQTATNWSTYADQMQEEP